MYVGPVVYEDEGGLDPAEDTGVYEGAPALLVNLVYLDVDIEQESCDGGNWLD